MEKKTISDYTEAEFLEFVRNMCRVEGKTEDDIVKLVDEFRRLTEHPKGSDVIFYPDDSQEDSPEGIVAEVKKWRAENSKSGFKNG
ncbi:bacteriocin immunity protein [Salmonella enterica]|nr:bacteriocin immunity protein [Salmonella enterica]